ncbi:Asparagine synthase [Aquiflexum balticum DSM 16537]|uniref:asparagine synthase (glutamine-hydrolyzing) n=1 Tax=Aquiflexum balticum DSM 16537 TaxID=758820 RepID=A0A1W2HBS3_9BACT|nr:asparagine synthase-related protein [Aquiflexum balticum]SMD46307.1 Asparagine synthase [Aquiflexum balticum DSM 16537]
MSKIIWICSKKGFSESTEEKLKTVINFITPDNITPNQPQIKVDHQIAYGILNPKSNIRYHGNSVCLGVLFGDYTNWHQPLNEFPDGSFALFRDDETYAEIISDVAGSRTVWYYHDDDLLIAATSQFAIIHYLESFEFNHDVIPWILTTGTLGPDFSWDKRIQKLPPDSSIVLEKSLWKIQIKSFPIVYQTTNKSAENIEKQLQENLDQTFLGMDLSYFRWVLPLSGGYDSRGILHILKKNKVNPIKTITWGLKESLNDHESDSYIAKNLASKLNVEHDFFSTSFSNEPVDLIFERFLRNGEGRIDHFGGYLDGFKIWKTLHENKIDIIIRGDENFGWHNVYSKSDVFTSLGIKFFPEFKNFNKIEKDLKFNQTLPTYLQKKQNESLAQWRDRLYHEYRLQCMISALGDLKLAYVEQISPLLSKNVFQQVKSHPDKIRTGKVLWKKIVKEYLPKVPFASKEAISGMESFTKSEIFVNFITKRLKENTDNPIFDKDFINELHKNLKYSNTELYYSKNYNLKDLIKKIMPNKFYSFLKEKNSVQKKMDNNILAFRIVILFSILNLFKK